VVVLQKKILVSTNKYQNTLLVILPTLHRSTKNIQGRVVVTFKINTKGLVEIKSVTGGNKDLQEAAKKTF
tara:strand:- start:103 stop:312 length:210 start_codon:yes stop_codon:yes gene_type:complete